MLEYFENLLGSLTQGMPLVTVSQPSTLVWPRRKKMSPMASPAISASASIGTSLVNWLASCTRSRVRQVERCLWFYRVTGVTDDRKKEVGHAGFWVFNLQPKSIET